MPARIHDLQVRPKTAARLQTFHLAHRLPSRQQHSAVQGVVDGVVAGADLPVGLRPADQEVPGVVGHGILSLGAQRPLAWYLQHFPCGREEQRTLDATASYFFKAETPRRLLSAFLTLRCCCCCATMWTAPSHITGEHGPTGAADDRPRPRRH